MSKSFLIPYSSVLQYGQILVLCFLSTLFLFSCNTNKKIGETKLKKRSANYLLKKLESNQIKGVEWLSSKAKISYRDPSQSIKFSANIRMRKDSIIWMNVKKAGGEAARIQITPDSVYVINRLDNEYMIKDFKLLEDRFNFPANFTLLQDILLGKPILIPEAKMEASIDEQSYHLRDSDSSIKTNYWLYGISHLLEEMSFNNLTEKRSLSLTFEDYQETFDGQNFSYIRNINVKSPETGEVNIEIKLSKIEFNIPKTIKFEIPSRYTKID